MDIRLAVITYTGKKTIPESEVLSAGEITVAGQGVAATAEIDITAVGAPGLNLNTLTINGVSQISGPIAMTNGDPAQSATDVAADVTANSPEGWTAVAVGGLITLTAPYAGTAYNLALAVAADVGVTFTNDAATAGGLDGDGIITVDGGTEDFDTLGIRVGDWLYFPDLNLNHGRIRRVTAVLRPGVLKLDRDPDAAVFANQPIAIITQGMASRLIGISFVHNTGAGGAFFQTNPIAATVQWPMNVMVQNLGANLHPIEVDASGTTLVVGNIFKQESTSEQ